MILRILFSGIIVFSFFGNTMESGKKYSVGITIPNETYAKQENPVRLTIADLKYADDVTLQRAKQLLAQLNAQRPIVLNIGDIECIFGPENRPTIVLRRLTFENPALAAICWKLRNELGERKPDNWYVSLKEPRIQKEFENRGIIRVTAGKLYIKPSGNCAPIFTLE